MRLSSARACVLNFGRHRGRTVGEVVRTDPGYVTWLSDASGVGEYERKAARVVLDSIEHPRTVPYDACREEESA